MKEYELKVLDIDPDIMANRLKFLGAKLLFDQITTIDWYEFGGRDIAALNEAILTKSVVSKIHDFLKARSAIEIGDAGFFRLRKQDVYDLTFKYKAEKVSESSVNPFYEFEQMIDDETKVSKIKNELSTLNFFLKAHHEKRRASFLYKGIRFDIDTWPGLPSYIEIEALNQEDIYKGIHLLELQDHEISEDSGQKLFSRYNKNFWSDLSFSV